jgi:hypothetical protein
MAVAVLISNLWAMGGCPASSSSAPGARARISQSEGTCSTQAIPRAPGAGAAENQAPARRGAAGPPASCFAVFVALCFVLLALLVAAEC